MDREKRQMTESILSHALEIIYLLTGEDCRVVMKNGDELQSVSCVSQNSTKERQVADRSRNVNSPAMTREKILDHASRIIQLLTGELFMKELRHFEEHRGHDSDVTMEGYHVFSSMDYISLNGETMLKVKQENQSLTSRVRNLDKDIMEVTNPDYISLNGETTLNVKQENRLLNSRRQNLDKDILEVTNPDFENRKETEIEDLTLRGNSVMENNISQRSTESNESRLKCSNDILLMETSSGRCGWEQDHLLNARIGEPYITNPTMPGGDDDVTVIEVNHRKDNVDEFVPRKDIFKEESVIYTRNVVPGQTDNIESDKNIPTEFPSDQTYKNENMYVCTDCGKQFSRSLHLSVHRRTHTGEKPYTCSDCGKHFKSRSHLTCHVKTHSRQRAYICNECGKGFLQNAQLVRHQAAHSGERSDPCNADLVKHLIMHPRERPYVCAECGKSYTQGSSLVIHQRTHTGERPFSCDECGKSFISRAYFAAHQKIHTGQGTYICSDCGKSYVSRFHLRIHQRTHTGERPYACSECGKCFISRSDLVRHEKIHQAQRPYVCNDCGRRFTQSAHLIRHKKTHSDSMVQTV